MITDLEKQELVRIGIERAKQGDAQMLKFFLDRILPKQEALVEIELPEIKNYSDLADAQSAIVNAISAGELSAGEAGSLASILHKIGHFLPDVEVEHRIRDLEHKLEELRRKFVD